MEEREARIQVVSAGKELLRAGLVARTWGNVSARLDEERFLITPSGLDYLQTTEDDLAAYNRVTQEWTGPYKPSSEKGVHTTAYEIFPEANFVIHTHQTYATAVGIVGLDSLVITREEKELLGGVAEASYGLPGTKKLKNAVRKAMETGAHTILMKHHGAIVVGTSKDETFKRIKLLEKICKKCCLGVEKVNTEDGDVKRAEILNALQDKYQHVAWETSDATVCFSNLGEPLFAEMDDMAQMIGKKIPVYDGIISEENTASSPRIAEQMLPKLMKFLDKYNAVLVPGLGAIVMGADEGDMEALKILVNKSCVSALNTKTRGLKKRLGAFDVMLMHFIYKKKYS